MEDNNKSDWPFKKFPWVVFLVVVMILGKHAIDKATHKPPPPTPLFSLRAGDDNGSVRMRVDHDGHVMIKTFKGKKHDHKLAINDDDDDDDDDDNSDDSDDDN